ncbi:Flp family type IVb pilin [Egicoccus halophilus]|nr:Flp family type IVb pilin [Egicoccus halophilus]
MRRIEDESGAQMAEYGLLLAGIAAVAALAVGQFGGRTTALYTVVQAMFP